ncbi:peptidylprolyl isomerase [Clostridium estertheticum]|uniref:peptidylprolyl isomerase n=1 Tax=Clostridium estertheticum TaxID=238834 RepID=A0AA47EMS6_9CLOT|nr:peptidylprolyl isomerase [Clostridium estertheticum]MBU3156103.1 peptidylprolyl isomerase [Clostridium estertheticum]MBU3199334.1 peptidylprolyl isomerase [Clostridium estertheticum]WAG63103.1 peptidylprolyl isomerase [Clostridium estertheticum]WAG68006.1 peptidylprolyl isomerase [Clostridium estertheticum]
MKLIKKSMILFTLIFVVFASGCGNIVQKNSDTTSKDVKTQTKVVTEKGVKDKNPLVTIVMEDGSTIKIELYPEIAPNTVRNFVSLANSGFYNGLIFHRVMSGFMIQGGDPKGTGSGGPGYAIKGEFSENNFNNTLKHGRGVISMARTDTPDSAGSQFFIVVADSDNNSASLDGKYAAFGKVTKGMEVVDKIVSVETGSNNKPKKDQKMKKVTVDTFGVKYGEVQKVK